MNLQDQKYLKKSKSISSAETNYLSQFEMRYPVYSSLRFWFHIKQVWTSLSKKNQKLTKKILADKLKEIMTTYNLQVKKFQRKIFIKTTNQYIKYIFTTQGPSILHVLKCQPIKLI